MLFSELYSAYYRAVADILSAVIEGKTDDRELSRIVSEKAFGESMLTILPALKSGRWQLLFPDGTTPLRHKPTMPLTLLEKRWLKAVSLDPRIRLFDFRLEGLEDVVPLFTPEDFCLNDRYADGDPFEDEDYIARFRFLLGAIHGKAPVTVTLTDRRGKCRPVNCLPLRLEYSEKNDKFRLVTGSCRFFPVINLANITSVAPCPHPLREIPPQALDMECMTLLLRDERQAFQRCMLHFAHFERKTERLDKRLYRIRICYPCRDEAEMVIRILSFGPMVEVIEPERLRQSVIRKLKEQQACGLF